MKYFVFIFGFLFSSSLLAQNLIPFRHGDQWGYLNKAGLEIVPAIYDSAEELFFGRGLVQKEKKYGFIDDKGFLAIGLKYDAASSFNRLGYASVVINEKKYCIDPKQNKVACVKGCGLIVSSSVGSLQIFRKGGKIGLYINKSILQDGKKVTELIPPTWDSLIENSLGYAAVKIDSQWAIINDIGEYMTPFLYDNIEINRSNGYFKVMKNNKYGLLDFRGDVVCQPKYHKLNFFSKNHLAKAWLNKNFWFYIDKKGREYYRKS